MLLIQVLLIQVSTIIIFDNLYVQNQSTTTAQALARTKTRMTTWLNSNFRGRWKEVSGPNVTLASNQWMIVMRIGKQGGNYDYHYWYPDVVSVRQMCIMLGGISMKTAYKLLGNGEIHHLKIGKSFKIPKICVIEYLLG